MKGVEVKISATLREFALLAVCVKLTGDLLRKKPEERSGKDANQGQRFKSA